MEVILIQDVKNLGYKDDVVKVKDGYGRNYLIPNRLAVIASESAKKVLAENKRQQAHKQAKMLADAQALGAQLEALQLTLSAKASENGKIFGAITAQDIADELAKMNLVVDKKNITVEPVKELGEGVATARLHREVTAEIHFTVVAAE